MKIKKNSNFYFFNKTFWVHWHFRNDQILKRASLVEAYFYLVTRRLKLVRNALQMSKRNALKMQVFHPSTKILGAQSKRWVSQSLLQRVGQLMSM